MTGRPPSEAGRLMPAIGGRCRVLHWLFASESRSVEGIKLTGGRRNNIESSNSVNVSPQLRLVA